MSDYSEADATLGIDDVKDSNGGEASNQQEQESTSNTTEQETNGSAEQTATNTMAQAAIGRDLTLFLAPEDMRSKEMTVGQENPNLFVNFLPAHVTDDGLRALFVPYGTVESSKVMLDLNTGQSRCFGFVKFRTVDEANRASSAMNGYSIDGKRLVVKQANPTKKDSYSKGVPGVNVYVKNMPKTCTEADMTSLYSRFGTVEETKVLIDPTTGVSKGSGFVRFTSQEEANAAIDGTHNYLIQGMVMESPLWVRYADTEEQKQERKEKNRQRREAQNRMTMGVPAMAGLAPQMAMYGMTNQRYSPYPNYSGGASGTAATAYPGYYLDPATGQYKMSAAGAGTTPAATGAVAGASVPADQRTLFVYNVPQNADDGMLYRIFSPYGALEKVTVVTDKMTGRSKGFGFVTMVNYHEAYYAVQALNGQMLEGKPLQVSFRRPKQGGGGMGGSMGY